MKMIFIVSLIAFTCACNKLENTADPTLTPASGDFDIPNWVSDILTSRTADYPNGNVTGTDTIITYFTDHVYLKYHGGTYKVMGYNSNPTYPSLWTDIGFGVRIFDSSGKLIVTGAIYPSKYKIRGTYDTTWHTQQQRLRIDASYAPFTAVLFDPYRHYTGK